VVRAAGCKLCPSVHVIRVLAEELFVSLQRQLNP